MQHQQHPSRLFRASAWRAVLVLAPGLAAAAQTPHLQVSVDPRDGTYAVSTPAHASDPVLRAGAAAEVNGHWLYARDYPQHVVTHTTSKGELGEAGEWTVRYTGRHDAPELIIRLRSYNGAPFGDLRATVRNTTSANITVQAIRCVDAGPEGFHLHGSPERERVISDSFSEDRPAMRLRDLTDADKGVHRAVGSQTIYDRESHESWFLGALTSDKYLSVLRLRMSPTKASQITSYEVDSTGTTELLLENSLATAATEDRVALSLPLAPGAELAGERMLFSVAADPHMQLETYGRLVRDLHHARVTAPTPIGWWSWTAYYFGLNEATALTNAQWMAQHLAPYGYNFFHIDEGYQFARGEYATADASLFPQGLGALERKVTGLGLTPGIWTAPFEVSERSWIFAHHPEWLVHNAGGTPIHLGKVENNKDQLYALDTTHPEAQAYLRATYRTLTRDWGIRYIKLDFMEDSAVEGMYSRPNTTALEAQRIGLQTLREAVGDEVLLDKDGCEMLNLVGYVDMGRISQDTGHTFLASKEAAPGIAARYYMNRNFFVADPDAFTVSQQVIRDQDFHNDTHALTFDEAKISIALTAVSGGLFEDGDNLPSLGGNAERTALLTNTTMLDMARLGRASVPLDLLDYRVEDLQPSLFLLHEDDHQSVLTLFNWSEGERTHKLTFTELGLIPGQSYTAVDAFDEKAQPIALREGTALSQPAHTVRMLRIVNESTPASPPSAVITAPKASNTGASVPFAAEPKAEHDAILNFHWDFGDGVAADGQHTTHAYTQPGSYTVKLTTSGLGGVAAETTAPIAIDGLIPTKFRPEQQRRLEPPPR